MCGCCLSKVRRGYGESRTNSPGDPKTSAPDHDLLAFCFHSLAFVSHPRLYGRHGQTAHQRLVGREVDAR